MCITPDDRSSRPLFGALCYPRRRLAGPIRAGSTPERPDSDERRSPPPQRVQVGGIVCPNLLAFNAFRRCPEGPRVLDSILGGRSDPGTDDAFGETVIRTTPSAAMSWVIDRFPKPTAAPSPLPPGRKCDRSAALEPPQFRLYLSKGGACPDTAGSRRWKE